MVQAAGVEVRESSFVIQQIGRRRVSPLYNPSYADGRSPGVQPKTPTAERPRGDPGRPLLPEELLPELLCHGADEGAGGLRVAGRRGDGRPHRGGGNRLEPDFRTGGRGGGGADGAGGPALRVALTACRGRGGGGLPALHQDLRREGIEL